MTQVLNKNPISWTYIPSTPILSDFLYQDNYSHVLNWNNDTFDYSILNKNGRRSSDEPGSPPHRGDELGDDPTKCPGKEFEWKGDGPPGSKQGSWVKGSKKTGNLETLRPDLDHPKPIGPHWDYTGSKAPDGARLFPDGTWEPKL